MISSAKPINTFSPAIFTVKPNKNGACITGVKMTADEAIALRLSPASAKAYGSLSPGLSIYPGVIGKIDSSMSILITSTKNLKIRSGIGVDFASRVGLRGEFLGGMESDGVFRVDKITEFPLSRVSGKIVRRVYCEGTRSEDDKLVFETNDSGSNLSFIVDEKSLAYKDVEKRVNHSVEISGNFYDGPGISSYVVFGRYCSEGMPAVQVMAVCE